MLASLILTLREGMEAALVIGVILGVLRKVGRQDLIPSVWVAAVAAVGVSLGVALGLNWLNAEFKGRGEQLFEGGTMILAAGSMTWMVFWMHGQAAELKHKVEMGIHRASTGRWVLFFLAFLAVVREGIELVVFLLAARLASDPLQELFGAAIGLGLVILLAWLIMTSSRRLNLVRFFQVTDVLLGVFSAGLVGMGIGEFNELGWIPSGIEHVWSLNTFLPDTSIVGQLLHALVGYSSSPSLSQVMAYAIYVAVLCGLLLLRHFPALFHTPVVKQ